MAIWHFSIEFAEIERERGERDTSLFLYTFVSVSLFVCLSVPPSHLPLQSIPTPSVRLFLCLYLDLTPHPPPVLLQRRRFSTASSLSVIKMMSISLCPQFAQVQGFVKQTAAVQVPDDDLQFPQRGQRGYDDRPLLSRLQQKQPIRARHTGRCHQVRPF